MLRTLGARLFTLPVSAIFSLLTSQLVISHYGLGDFAYFGLLASLLALFSFADLGVGAALNNEVASDPTRDGDSSLTLVLLSVIRTLLLSATVLLSLVIVVTIFGLWDTLLGTSARPPRPAAWFRLSA